MLQLTYGYFDVNDGNDMTIEQRISEALKLLQNEEDYIIFEDGKICQNEHELLSVLKEKGGIL